MGTVASALAWARSQLGTEETGGPSGHDGNVTPYWTEIHHGEEEGQPWCAAFVEAALEATGTAPIVDSQYCPTILDAYRKAGRAFPISAAQPGDQVLYNFGEPSPPNHTGMVESVDPVARTVTALEGNTEPAQGGDQADGGGVYRRTRPWSCVMAVGRPHYALAPAPPTPTRSPLMDRPGLISFLANAICARDADADELANLAKPGVSDRDVVLHFEDSPDGTAIKLARRAAAGLH